MSVFELFSDRNAAYGNVLLNWQSDPAEEIISYAQSYQRSAMRLIASYDGNKIVAIDQGALPVLFLYRHSFELFLKAVAYHAALFSIKKTELNHALPHIWREHSLLHLVKIVLPIIRRSHPLAVMDGLEGEVFSLAEKLDKIDPGSYSFRYPVSTKGNASLPENFLTNIFTFSEAMESVLDNLSQLCRHLKGERAESLVQMKLALHSSNGS